MAKDSRECLRYAYIHKDGLQYVCDAYVLLGSKNHFQLPLLPSGLFYPDIDRIKPGYSEKSSTSLLLPDISYLKAEIKIAKNIKKKPVFYFGIGFQFVDANFLIDVLEVIPGAQALTVSENDYNLKVIEFKNEQGDYGILFPLRPILVLKQIEDGGIYLIEHERSE